MRSFQLDMFLPQTLGVKSGNNPVAWNRGVAVNSWSWAKGRAAEGRGAGMSTALMLYS